MVQDLKKLKIPKIVRSIIKRLPGTESLFQPQEIAKNSDLMLQFLSDIFPNPESIRLVGIDIVCESLVRNIKQNNIANFYAEIAYHMMSFGLQTDAAAMFENSLKIRHDNRVAINYLQNLMCCSPKIYTQEKILNITKEVMKKIAVVDKKYSDHSNELSVDRVINVGYTCHFFDNTTGTTLFLPIIKNHNRQRVKIFIYSDQEPTKTRPETMKLADVWRDVYGMSDEELCETIKKDKIDVMLEINGFCNSNRYRAFNMRPAPVQVSFYNLSATSGVEEIDYILVGEEVRTEHLSNFYTEKFFHKKGIQLATEVGSHFPSVKNKIPFHENGYITFGSFGQAHKVSREQIFLWAKVLHKVENSKFFMKANALDGVGCLAAFKRHFNDAGIDDSRLIFEGNSEYNKFLLSYEKIDIALDTYPYGAGTTTIEALIQGTPVVSLVGDNFCSQHGAINLKNVNHPELLSYSPEEFVEKAVSLANDVARIEKYCKNLRQDVISSARSDIKKYVKELEDAYIEMFSRYVKKCKTATHNV